MHPENPTITNQYIKLKFHTSGFGINISCVLSNPDIFALLNLKRLIPK